MRRGTPVRGFTLIELMVAIAIVALTMVLAAPSFGNATRSARERNAVQKLVQDFAWARGAAGAGDAAAWGTSSGSATVVLTLKADCSWTTTVNGTVNDAHSYTAAQLAAAAPGIGCAGTSPALPAAFTFSAQGFVSTTGTVTYTGASGQAFTLTILYSGSVIRGNAATGMTS